MFGDAVHMGMAVPVMGTGAGTFMSAYPVWRTLPTSGLSPSPHNEYLHVFAETGFPGLLLLGAAIGIFAWIVLRGFVDSRRPWARGFLAGAIGAVIAPTLHSLVDFPMRSPAIAATFAVVLALLVRTSQLAGHPSPDATPESAPARPGKEEVRKHRRRKKRVKTLHHSFERFQGSGGRKGIATGAAIGLVALAVGWLLACNLALDPLRGNLMVRKMRRLGRQVYVTGETEGLLPALEATEEVALKTVPENASLYAHMAQVARTGAQAAEEDEKSIALAYRALQMGKMAVRLEPLNQVHSRQLAVDYLRFKKHELAATYAERVFKLVPRDPMTWANLAEDFSAYGDHERALSYLERARVMAEEHGMDSFKARLEHLDWRLRERAGR
jgi:hypothetical protein